MALARGVVDWLLASHLLSEDDVVFKDLTVEQSLGRHHHFIVRVSTQKTYFVKVATEDSRRPALRNEARVYELLGSLPAMARGGRNSVLGLLGFSDDPAMLAIEYASGAKTFREIAVENILQNETTQEIGAALGTIHSSSLEVPAIEGLRIASGGSLWVLSSLLRTPLVVFENSSVANLTFIAHLQDAPALLANFDRIRADCRPVSLIHNDFKWDNVLVACDEASFAGIAFVDWELSTLGDPLWDVGSFLSDFLWLWLSDIPACSGSDLHRVEKLSQYPLADLALAAQSFWAGYASTSGLRLCDETVARVMEYTAVRLLQTNYEQLQFFSKPTPASVYSAQLSLNILENPIEAASALLGIGAAFA